MMLRGSLSEDDRAKLARMLEHGEGDLAPKVPTWEEWGTSREAVRGLHDAMRFTDRGGRRA